MTGSLRLSALLLLLLSRWASADLEKGEDEFVRSWVIIEEQLVPPSRDELLAAGGGGGGTAGGGGTGRRITPKSVFVAPAFNKCSDGYRADSMGRCVKVVKLNQAAQWDFLLKQLNSQYNAGGMGVGFPMMPAAAAASVYQPAPMTTTTTEPPQQKTDSPGPFQLNIPLSGGGVDLNNQTMEPVDELTTSTPLVGTTIAGTTTPTTTTTTTTATATDATVTAITGEDSDVTGTAAENMDDQTTATTVLMETTVTARPRPYRNRYQTSPPPLVQEAGGTVTPSYGSTTTGTDTKTK